MLTFQRRLTMTERWLLLWQVARLSSRNDAGFYDSAKWHGPDAFIRVEVFEVGLISFRGRLTPFIFFSPHIKEPFMSFWFPPAASCH